MLCRRLRILFFVCFFVLCGDGFVVAQDVVGFDVDCFCIDLSIMSPATFSSRVLSSGYYLGLRNDSVFLCMPYMGKVYQPGFDCDGLCFSLPVNRRLAVVKDNGDVCVEFFVKKSAGRYKFVVTAYEDGRADIYLKPDHAQSVYYGGRWDVGSE